MTREEIKEYLNRVDKLVDKLTGEDEETLNWLIYGYNQCAKLLNETEEENQKYKKVIDKANKKLTNMFDNGDDNKILDDLLELSKIFEVE